MHVDGKSAGPEYDAVIRQLKQPLFTFGEKTDLYTEQLRHHVRFSLEFLLRDGHLDPNGCPLQWSGLLTHLHYEEPSNFVLTRWLRQGLLHNIARIKNTDVRRKSFIHIFSCIFQLEAAAIHSSAPKGIHLPPLPEEFQREIHEHNQYVLQVYQLYLRAFIRSSALLSQQVERMPLSNVWIQPEGELPLNEPLLGFLASFQVSSEIRSIYFRLVGLHDKFSSAEELVATARSELLLDLSLLPVLVRPPAQNNHLLAYFGHRQLERILVENKVSPGDFTRFSEGFLKIIKKIHTVVKIQSSDDDVLRIALDDLRVAYQRCRDEPSFPYGPIPNSIIKDAKIKKEDQAKASPTKVEVEPIMPVHNLFGLLKLDG